MSSRRVGAKRECGVLARGFAALLAVAGSLAFASTSFADGSPTPSPSSAAAPTAAPGAPRAISSRHRAGWGLIAAGGSVVAAGIAFQIVAAIDANQLALQSEMRDPVTGLPLVSYSTLAALDAQRSTLQWLAIGCFASGVAALVPGIVLAALPDRHATPVVLVPWLGGASLSLHF